MKNSDETTNRKKEKITIELFKPRYTMGQVIYIPQKDEVVETAILGYDARIGERDRNLLGVISGYHIRNFVSVRRGDDSDLTSVVLAKDFYEDKEKAQKASRFLEVKLDEETWRLAVGDRDIEDENSPYNLENCNLSICCANISEARDILLYCRRNDGLIVHDRDELANLVNEHGLEYDAQSSIARIFEQLKI